MRASPTPLGLAAAIRAYLISHLGKYVPGKAMVVVMRVGLVDAVRGEAGDGRVRHALRDAGDDGRRGPDRRRSGSRRGRSPRSCPSAGAVVAVPLGLLGLALGVAFLVVVDPAVFPRLSGLASVPFPGVGPEALPRFTRRLLGEGLLWSLAGWVFLGLSQVAVIRAFVPSGVAPCALAAWSSAAWRWRRWPGSWSRSRRGAWACARGSSWRPWPRPLGTEIGGRRGPGLAAGLGARRGARRRRPLRRPPDAWPVPLPLRPIEP